MKRQSRQVVAGVGKVEAAPMIDSAPLLQAGQIDTAKERLAKDGYLLLQNYLSAERLSEVLSASPLLVLNSFLQHRGNDPLVQARTFLLDELHRWKPECCTSEVCERTV